MRGGADGVKMCESCNVKLTDKGNPGWSLLFPVCPECYKLFMQSIANKEEVRQARREERRLDEWREHNAIRGQLPGMAAGD